MYTSFDYSEPDRVPIFTPQEAAALDKFSIEKKNVEGKMLMAWAGYSAFQFLRKEKKFRNAQVVHLLSGNGNNGGDGFALAYHILASTPKAVRVWMHEPPLSKESRYFYNLCLQFQESNRLEVNPLEDIENETIRKAVIVEAIFGNSFHGQLDEKIEKIFILLNRYKKNYRVTLDIAAGIPANGDFFTHTPFKADVTLAFGCARPGHLLEPGIFYGGQLQVMPIGFFPSAQFQNRRCFLGDCQWINMRELHTHKYKSGELWILGGSKGMEGAAIMCAYAFLKSGGGLARVYSPSKAFTSVIAEHPEIMAQYEKKLDDLEASFLQALSAKEKKQTVVIGVGLKERLSKSFWQKLCALKNVSLLLDGGVLRQVASVANILTQRKFSDLVLTPHKGEAEALLQTASLQYGQNAQARQEQNTESNIKNIRKATLSIAETYQATVYCKGPGGLLAGNQFGEMSEIYVNSKSCQLAVGGSGDILSGISAAMLARDKDVLRAMRTAIFFHLRAAEKVLEKIALQNTISEKKLLKNDTLRDFFVPTDILQELPLLIKEPENE